MAKPGQKCSGFVLFGKGEGNTDEKYAYIDRETEDICRTAPYAGGTVSMEESFGTG